MLSTLRLAVVLLIAVFAIVPGLSAEPAAEEARARAAQATKALGRELMQHLQRELSANGPAGAVRVCSEIAPDVASAHSTDGLVIRRVSLRTRNPANAPDDFERDVLARFQELLDRGELPDEIAEVVRDESGTRLRYLRPIRIAAPCLTCHGPAGSLNPEVAALLKERYPADRATGYGSGELRGAFSVVVEIE